MAITIFPYYGGKFYQLKWILSHLDTKHNHYVEPFGGAAVVLLNKPKSNVETYNDLHGELVNFFRQLRNQPENLIRVLKYTPYAREEFWNALINKPDDPSQLERARRFFILMRQGRSGIAKSISHWGVVTKLNKSLTVNSWKHGLHFLEFFAKRLSEVQIENRPAIDCIKYYDSKRTLFYCDPPYLPETRESLNVYKYEMVEYDHKKLAYLLNKVQGKVVLSGYRSDLYDDLYMGWCRSEKRGKVWAAARVKKRAVRIECLWSNF